METNAHKMIRPAATLIPGVGQARGAMFPRHFASMKTLERMRHVPRYLRMDIVTRDVSLVQVVEQTRRATFSGWLVR